MMVGETVGKKGKVFSYPCSINCNNYRPVRLFPCSGDNADPVSCPCYIHDLCAPFLHFKLYIIL